MSIDPAGSSQSENEDHGKKVLSNIESDGDGWPLKAEEYRRYGRQMILPEIGLEGQLNLKRASVLVVGLGGLGCPAATYLAGAGVGTLGLIDGDTVEMSNLHRQILHRSDRIGWLKVDSAVASLKQQNAEISYRTYPHNLEPSVALEIMDAYDLVLDCTDHPSSRYLISDAAVLAGKPLVSASALRTDGQLLVLNNPPTGSREDGTGFCYRCVFPNPPPAESVGSCGENGVLGPVVGVMGVLMAVEALKIITRLHKKPLSDQNPNSNVSSLDTPTLLIYSAYGFPPFRSARLRGKRRNCLSCSSSATITRKSFTSGSISYQTLCNPLSPAEPLPSSTRLSAPTYKLIHDEANKSHILIDVREPSQFSICRLPHSHNIPLSVLPSDPNAAIDDFASPLSTFLRSSDGPVYFICRFGNDSQQAVRRVKDLPAFSRDGRKVMDIKGGLEAWRREVDPKLPEY